MTLALAGLIAGFLHVMSGPDHLAAMAPYAVEGKRRAWRTGVRWGLGNTAGVLGVGLLALLLRDTLHIEALASWGGRCVGFMLIGIGFWAAMRATLVARGVHSDQPRHEKRARVHGRVAFAVGTMHGLAGSSHVLGIMPALLLPWDFAAATYLLLFGAGSVLAMGTFSSLAGWLANLSSTCPITQSALLAVCSVLAFSIGGIWLVDNFGDIPAVASLG